MLGGILSSIFGTSNDFRADTAGQNFQQALLKSQGQYDNTLQNQDSLAKSLQAQASGVGPNPAQAMLNQATDQNIANNAALIASAKGASPALAQRLAAQNAANMSQEAAGQGAVIQANQQVNAQNQLGGLYGNMANQSLQNQNITQSALNSNNSINAGVTQGNTNSQNQLVGGLLSGVGSFLGKAHGGVIPGPEIVEGDSEKNDVVPVMASGGEIIIPKTMAKDPEKAKSFIDQIMAKESKPKESAGYGKIVELKRRIAALEKKVG